MSLGTFETMDAASDGAADLRLIMDLLQSALAPYVTNHHDPLQAMAYAIGALPMYAGTIFANLVVTGQMDQSQQARMAKATASNFREGVKVGLRRAERIIREDGLMGGVQ